MAGVVGGEEEEEEEEENVERELVRGKGHVSEEGLKFIFSIHL